MRRERWRDTGRALLGLPLTWALMACSTTPSASASDDRLARALVGVWCNSDDGGRTCWAFDEFRASGDFEACGRHADERHGFRGGGRFTVNGRRRCYVVEHATPNFWLQAGRRYCTDILSIGSERHRYRDIDTQQEFELLRVPASRKACPATQ